MSEQQNEGLGQVAIVSMEARVPGADTLDRFWANVRDGVESVQFFSTEKPVVRGGVAHVQAAPLLDGIELFDAGFFGFSPGEADVMDPQIRLFLECAWIALEKAGCDPHQCAGRVGVFAGSAGSTYLTANLLPNIEALRGSAGALASFGVYNDRDALATLTAYKFDLTGPAVTVQTFCSTSLVAVHLACQSLLAGECDLALAGGASINVGLRAGYVFQEGGILSPDGHTRTFDAGAGGTVFGNGVGVVGLKRLADARADGDPVLAVILGSAVNNDGAQKAGYTAPSVKGQSKAIAEAIALAGVPPDSISYVEAHGTATAVGDPIEVEALTRAYRTGTSRRGFCAIGSVKANLGHLDRAAGVTSLIKAVLMMRHRELPPLVHYERPNPKIDFDSSPFVVNTTRRPWTAETPKLRAGVSSLGVGGTNAHVVIEEAPPAPASGPSRPSQLVVVSGRTETALEAATDRLVARLREDEAPALPDVAHTLLHGRRRFEHRRTVVASSCREAADLLAARDARRVFTAYGRSSERPVVFMFPGQGAQYAGMTRGLYETEAVFRQEVDASCERLQSTLGRDLRDVLFPPAGAEEVAGEALKQTALTQPALFIVEHALARLLGSWGIEPAAMIGHSVGEYVAATLAGVLRRDDALALVAERGRLMQSMPPGSMLAIPLGAAEVEPLLRDGVALAAVNAPALCVASGPTPAVDALQGELQARGVAVTRLHTSHAFHSSMMDPILGPFRERLAGTPLAAPRVPFVSNLTGTWITAEQATSPDYWTDHLRRAVRFADGVRTLLAEPDRVLLEVGPGNTLTTLARAQAPRSGTAAATTVRHPQDKDGDLAVLLSAIGRLWAAGVRLDAARLYAGERRRSVELPTYPFERERYWVDVEEGAPSAFRPASAKKDPSQWFYLPAWKAGLPVEIAPSKSNGSARGGAWLFLCDEGGRLERLAASLREQGDVVVVVRPGVGFAGNSRDGFTLDPAARPSYDKLFRSLGEQGKTIGRIVHGFSAGPARTDGLTREAITRAQDRGFYSLLHLVQALADAKWTQLLQLKVVTTRAQAVLADDHLEPEKATVFGLLKVAPQEHHNVTASALDVDEVSLEPERARALLAELRSDAAGTTVALRRGQRFVQGFEGLTLPLADGRPPRLRERGVYLITGGLGGVGFVLAATLAHACKARLVLTSRSKMPPREGWSDWRRTRGDLDPTSVRIARVETLEGMGAEVELVAADVANVPAMEAGLAAAEARFGALNGAIHAAGIVGGGTFRPLTEIGTHECEQQLHPKVAGLVALDEVLGDRLLDFCMLTSSLSSVLGGFAYGAYAAANVFMDAYTAARNREARVPWLSVNWDEWRLVESAEDDRTGLGRFAMSAVEGGVAFLRLLGLADVPQAVVSTGDLAGRIRQWVSLEGLHAGDAKPKERTRHARPHLQNAFVAPSTPAQTTVARIWAELLGIEKVGIQDNFFDLGGHSLLAIQVVTRIKAELSAEISVATLFEGPTVESLCRLIAPAPEEASGSFDQSSDRGRRRKEERLRRQAETAVEESA
jgi:phthiocerol/phenolphthiocerol synthesis type-I polyketide synthase E